MFSGSTPDKSTVKEILGRLKKEFSVEQCVFVGDRGTVTKKNTQLLAQLQYPYIVGYHKRGRVVSDALLERYRDGAGYTKLRDNLSFREVSATQVDDDEKDSDTRYVLCHNPIKAKADEAFRVTALEEAQNALPELQQRLDTPHRGRKPGAQSVMLKVSEILTRRGVQEFFTVDFDGQWITYTRNEAALAKEALRDGLFVIKTNTALPTVEVVTSYKTLLHVERAFREIKNFLDVGPMVHWNEKRVRGHIFICVPAYLFEQEIQVMYRRSWEQQDQEVQQIDESEERTRRLEELHDRYYTGEWIVKELSRWHALQAEFLGKEFLSVPPPPSRLRDVLQALSIPLPAKAIQVHDTSTRPFS